MRALALVAEMQPRSRVSPMFTESSVLMIVKCYKYMEVMIRRPGFRWQIIQSSSVVESWFLKTVDSLLTLCCSASDNTFTQESGLEG